MTDRGPKLLEPEDVLALLPPELEAEVRLADPVGGTDIGVRLRSKGLRLFVDVVRSTKSILGGHFTLEREVVAEEVLVWDARTEDDLAVLADAVFEAAKGAGLWLETDEEKLRPRDGWEWTEWFK